MLEFIYLAFVLILLGASVFIFLLWTFQVALAWGINRGTPVLPKAVSDNHIRENLTALDVKLDTEDMATINGISIHQRYLKQTWMFKPEEVPADLWDGEE